MFDKLMSVNQSKLKWALVVLGINSFFVSGTLRLQLNIAIFLIALWILVAFPSSSSTQRSSKGDPQDGISA